MKKPFLILLIFLTSCGYKPIYLKNDQSSLEFNKIISIGDNRINRQIINTVGLKETSSNDNELTLKSTYNIEETSKNSKGQVNTYRSSINLQLTITRDDKIIKRRNFLNEFSYNNKNNKFKLNQYQNEIKNNLINKLSEEIILFMNLS